MSHSRKRSSRTAKENVPCEIEEEEEDEEYQWITFASRRICVRKADGYMNAAIMCHQGGKRYKHWHKTASAKKLIASLETKLGIPVTDLVLKRTEYRGTYVHPALLTAIAQWISADFGAGVCMWIEEWKEIDDNAARYYQALSELEGDSCQQPEAVIRDRLAKKLRGKTEVACDVGYVGRIDVLTKRYVIEVKSCANWTHGIGQLLMYGRAHPDHKLRLHLFDHDADKYDHEKIRSLCSDYNVRLTFE